MELLVYLHFNEGTLDLCQVAVFNQLLSCFAFFVPHKTSLSGSSFSLFQGGQNILSDYPSVLGTFFPFLLSCLTSSRSSKNFLNKDVSLLCCYACIIMCVLSLLSACYGFMSFNLTSLLSLFLRVILSSLYFNGSSGGRDKSICSFAILVQESFKILEEKF